MVLGWLCWVFCRRRHDHSDNVDYAGMKSEGAMESD
jgi:hypothetical protein